MTRLALLLFLAVGLAACDSGAVVPETCENESIEIEIEELAEGSCCDTVGPNDTVTLSYTGMLTDGTVFDDNDRTDAVDIRSFISGFQEGVRGMKRDGRRRLTIPPYRGYATRPVTRIIDEEEVEIIPSCSTLVFEVEVIDILT